MRLQLLSAVMAVACTTLLGSACQVCSPLGVLFGGPTEPVICETYDAVDHLISQGVCCYEEPVAAQSAPCSVCNLGEGSDLSSSSSCSACAEAKGGDRILVATLVDINDVNSGSMFGLQMAEFIAARLTQNGHTVIQTTLRDGSVVINSGGQFLLSRETEDLNTQYDAKAACVGTYGVTEEHVFVSLRMVCTKDNSLMGATDYVLDMDEQLRFMLETQSGSIATW
jgi:hypothetical protein